MWLPVTIYPYLNWPWIFSIWCMHFFFPLSPKICSLDLTVYIYIYKYTKAGDYPIRSSNWLPFESTYVHPRIWWDSLENICSPPYLMGFMRAHIICSPPYLMGFMLMNLYGFLYCVMHGIFILFVFVFYAQCCQNL